MENDYNPDEILDFLVGIAKRDGIVSKDEQSFLDAMNQEIEKYKIEYNKSLEDKKITAEEKAKLFQTRFQMLQKAINIVRKDMEVTNEEEELLRGLQVKLSELHNLENEFMNFKK